MGAEFLASQVISNTLTSTLRNAVIYSVNYFKGVKYLTSLKYKHRSQ